MIRIKMTNINGILCPEEKIPFPNFGTFIEGTYTVVCETIEEAEEFMSSNTPTLEEAKQEKCRLIDARTQELIFEGFPFAGLQWSLSLTAQINWSNLPNIPEQFFPLPIQDMNEQSYELTYSNRMNFYLTAVGAKNARLQSGSALKSQVNSLLTIENILNFIDPR